MYDQGYLYGGGQQGMEEHMEDHTENMKNKAFKSLREVREAEALEDGK